MANRTLSYHEVTRPTLETRLARLRDCRSHGEQGLDDEIQTLCQALTAIDALSAENARLQTERDRALMESIRVDAENAMLREALEECITDNNATCFEHRDYMKRRIHSVTDTARAALAGKGGA